MKKSSAKIVFKYNSPAGVLVLGSDGDNLCLCDWDEHEGLERTTPAIELAISQLDEYFAGTRCKFNVPLQLNGTAFQKTVWEELLKIPYGTTTSYAEIAYRIGNPKGVRAVANAIGANLISILIPCHRVVGSNGKLRGYRGGVHAKQTLLDIENKAQWT